MDKKNIILIATDGVRADSISSFKNFEKLSKQGTFFSNAMSYAPYSIASFHAIFTGIYGNRNGVDNYYGVSQFKMDNCKTLTSYLHEVGYYTIGDIMNKIVVPHDGFDELSIADPTRDIFPKHKQIIEKCGELKKTGKNFFAFLHCDYVHNSLIRDVVKQYTDFSKEYFENKKENKKRYESYIQNADDYLSKLMDEITRQNIQDSIILIFSDHGCSLGEKIGEKVYGSFCYDYTIMSFGIFLNNELFPKREFSQLVRTIDFMPTILDILQIPHDKRKMELDGKSLMGFICKEESESRIGFSETGGLGGPYPSPEAPNVHCIRTNKWKLIFNKTPKTYELYDLKNDPEELNNLFGSKEYQKIQNDLLKDLRRHVMRLKEWLKQK
ncbi:MAG: sulfatase-like hydrolase/transferase [Candidatus Micrarchaeia archaeon]